MSPGGSDGDTFQVGNGDTFHITGPEGGPFPVGRRVYELQNRSKTRVIEWEAEASVPWLLFSERGGYLAPQASTEVTVGLDPEFAATLPVGDYPADIVFRDVADEPGEIYLAFLLTVEPNSPDTGMLAVSPDRDFDVDGDVGGPFTPATKSYVVENVGGEPVDWSASATESWVLLSGSLGGTLAPAQSATVVVGLDDGMTKGFGVGTYVAGVKFDNLTNSMGSAIRRVNLTVSDPGGDDGRVTAGLQTLYEFDEAGGDTVFDTSGMQPPIDLLIENTSKAGWGPGSLTLESPTIVVSPSPASRLVDAVQVTDAITVEAWLQPKSIHQEGPARIVTMSDGSYERNFTLGHGRWQELPQDAYNMRLRTTTTDLDGMPLVTTDGGVVESSAQHVVYTRDANGIVKMWVDNVEQASDVVAGNLSNWDHGFRLALGNEIGADRPWLGTYHLVAVYDRALTPAEVQQNFLVGPGGGGAGIMAVAPTSDFTTSAVEGVSISESETIYSVSNIGDEPFQWSASSSEPWVTLEGSTGGNLDAGDSENVKVKLVSSIVLGFTPGFYTARVDFDNTDTGYGSTSRWVKLTVYSENGGGDGEAEMEYFEKSSGSLDRMGVRITRANGSQKVWAPGSPSQEYPGGWLTPGTYTIDINTPRVHGKNDGVLTGQKRSGDILVGVVVNKPLEWEGWENHAYTNHVDFELENWGATKTVNLVPGDVVHVGYGTPVPVTFGTRQGSDGVVFHCVADQPEPRGGLWGLGMPEYDQQLWDTFRNQVIAAQQFVTPNTNYYDWGPADGTLPAVIPSDLGQETGNKNNQQARTVGRWLLNRGYKMIQDGPGSLDVDEFERLFQFWCHNIQLMGQWGDGVGAMNHYAHGTHRYPPYFVKDSIVPALVAAVALDYKPTYEPLYRILSHMGQRTDMTMSNSTVYSFKNGTGGGDTLETKKDTDYYTKWLWYDLKLYDMTAKASHRMAAWGPCYWARMLLRYPQTARQAVTLSSVGPRFDNPDGSEGSWWGHEWIENGAGCGWHLFYADIEMKGAHFLWFAGVERDSQFHQFSRRSILATNSYADYYTQWVGNTYVDEPRNPSGSAQGGKSVLSWNAVSGHDFSKYRVYRSTQSGPFKAIADTASPSYTDSNVSNGNTYQYRITAVRSDGNESTKSDVVTIQH